MIQRLSAFVLPRINQIKVILMALFYCVISYQFFIYTDGFNPFYLNQFPLVHRNIGIGLLIICFILTIIFVFSQNLNWKSKIKAIFEINLVSFFSFLYYAINSKQSFLDISIFYHNLNINTGLVTIPLIFLIFLTVKNSLSQNTHNTVLLLSQVLLLFLSLFSIDTILAQDKSVFRGFNNIWFSSLFSIRPEVWTLLTIFLISVLTTFWLNLKDLKDLFTQCFTFFLIVLQAFLLLKLVAINSFGFWHKALFMIIFWDTFYYLYRVLNKNTPSSDLQLRIKLSVLYHIILFIILIFVSII